MALTECPRCGNPMNTSAAECPYCGFAPEPGDARPEMGADRTSWRVVGSPRFVGGLVIVILTLLVSLAVYLGKNAK